MAYGFNLHTVHNGMEKGSPIVLDAGEVHKYGDEDYRDLLKVDAIRKPTDTEMQLYFLANPEEAPEPEDGELDLDDEEAPTKGARRSKKAKAADTGELV